jgi:DNA polymerase I-like protein with 3'-5' exonuclease and polymerase domains
VVLQVGAWLANTELADDALAFASLCSKHGVECGGSGQRGLRLHAGDETLDKLLGCLEACAVLHDRVGVALAAAGSTLAYNLLEMPCSSVLAKLEAIGVGFDSQVFGSIADDMEIQLLQARNKACEAAGDDEFNPASAAQVAAKVYDELGLPPPSATHGFAKRARTGAKEKRHHSTDEETLQALQAQNPEQAPLLGAILEHRKLLKIKST